MLALCLLVAAAPHAVAASWNLISSGDAAVASGNSYGNTLTYYKGTEQLRVSAWANTGDGPGGEFETSYIQRFSTGLGICNRHEGTISKCVNQGLDHQVDNVGELEVVLFMFDSPQAMQSLVVDPYGTWDRDVSFWVGNVASSINLSGFTFDSLSGLGFSTQQNSFSGVSGQARTVDLNGLMGNALLVAALNPYDMSPDRFKIRGVTTTAAPVVPLPATAWLFLSAVGSLAGLRRLS